MADRIIENTTEYNDENGNRIQCGTDRVKIHLGENGRNNHVRIGNVSVGGCIDMYIRGTGNDILIEDGCVFLTRSLFMMWGGKLHIASGCTFGTGLLVIVHNHSEIILGKDCMSSYYLTFMAGDGHLIYDLETEEVINVEGVNTEDCFSGSIAVGEHVWFGIGSRIMGGVNRTTIGDGSIIGADAVVKGSFPNNAIIAGVPAKVVRKNIAWGRHAYGIDDMNEACNGYTRFTE